MQKVEPHSSANFSRSQAHGKSTLGEDVLCRAEVNDTLQKALRNPVRYK